jgi:glycerol-3-phosphate acyltransferase PlsY
VIRQLAALVASYLIGSIPWAYVAGRVLKGIDLRQHGSGNLGATNVQRTLGTPAAVVVLLLDAAKGAVPVLIAQRFLSDVSLAGMPIGLLCGVAAIVGHVRPVFLLGRGGGKGIATGAGVYGALAPIPLLVAIGVFAVVVATTRLMSLASLTGAAVLPIAVAVTRGIRDPMFAITMFVSALVFWTHRSNISRLRRGIEPRVGEKAAH